MNNPNPGEIWEIELLTVSNNEKTGTGLVLIYLPDQENLNKPVFKALELNNNSKYIFSYVKVNPSEENGLNEISFVNCDKFFTVSRENLVKFIGKIENEYITDIEKGLGKAGALKNPDSKISNDNIIFPAVITSIFSVFIAIFSVRFLSDYGWSLFALLPVAMGIISVLLYSRTRKRTLNECLKVSNLTLLISAGFLLLIAFEGVLCLAMAAPLAWILSSMGAVIGYALQLKHKNSTGAVLLLAFLLSPLSMGFEKLNHEEPASSEVKTSVYINAPPEKVWEVLTSFPEIPEPEQMIFKIGISYPRFAKITKKGVGGKIIWNFSTGVVEKQITGWQEKKLITYNIVKEPEMMKELSPYDIHPPHLQGYISSKKGYYKLEKTADGKTRLEGDTVYNINILPATYWIPQANYLHRIMQKRVLNNIKNISENF